MSVAPTGPIFTYQTRLGPEAALDTIAELYGRVERSLFADLQRGGQSGSLKSAYLCRHAIPARLFNAARLAVEGKIKRVQKLQVTRVALLKRRIGKARKVIARLEEK